MPDRPAGDDPGSDVPAGMDPREIGAHLRLDPAYEALAEIPAWMQHIEVLELADQVIGTDILVGRHPLFFLPLLGTDEHVAVLYDRNIAEPLGRELVRFTRSEDHGGFPTVAGLIEIRPGLAVSWPSTEAAAPVLEPLDPGLTVSDADRARWRAALRVDAFELRFRMDDDDPCGTAGTLRREPGPPLHPGRWPTPRVTTDSSCSDELTGGDILTARF